MRGREGGSDAGCIAGHTAAANSWWRGRVDGGLRGREGGREGAMLAVLPATLLLLLLLPPVTGEVFRAPMSVVFGTLMGEEEGALVGVEKEGVGEKVTSTTSDGDDVGVGVGGIIITELEVTADHRSHTITTLGCTA